MQKKISVLVMLYAVGILGGLVPILGKIDGAGLIIIGFGFAVLQLTRWIQQGAVSKENYKQLRVLSAASGIAAFSVMAYDYYKFPTNYNKIMFGVFIIVHMVNIVRVFRYTAVNKR